MNNQSIFLTGSRREEGWVKKTILIFNVLTFYKNIHFALTIFLNSEIVAVLCNNLKKLWGDRNVKQRTKGRFKNKMTIEIIFEDH